MKQYTYTPEQRPIIHTRLLLLHHKNKNSPDVRYSTIQAPTHSASATPLTHSSHPRPFPQPLSVPPRGARARFFEAFCVPSDRCCSSDAFRCFGSGVRDLIFKAVLQLSERAWPAAAPSPFPRAVSECCARMQLGLYRGMMTPKSKTLLTTSKPKENNLCTLSHSNFFLR